MAESRIFRRQKSFGAFVSPDSFILHVKCKVVDPENRRRIMEVRGNVRATADEDLHVIENRFLEQNPRVQTRDFYVKHNNLLFNAGTIKDCGIEEGDTVELYSIDDTKTAYQNEGYTCVFYGLLFFMIGLILFITAWVYDFGESIAARALFSTSGFIVIISAGLPVMVGVSQVGIIGKSSFSGEKWF